MANNWLRLWHDMPNDPKWRTISKISGQSIALVQAVYLQLLVSASQNQVTDETGVTLHSVTVTNEDIASALDVTASNVDSVTSAMQGRVLNGNIISGWDKRQAQSTNHRNPGKPAKSGAQRVREYRERKKLEAQLSNSVTGGNVTETLRNDVTTQIREEEKRKEENTDLKDPPLNPPKGKKVSEKFDPLSVELPGWLSAELWAEWVGFRKELKKPIKTLRGVTASIKSLDEYRTQGHSPESVINHCIANEYQGLYAPPQKCAQPKRDINHISEIDTKIPKGFRGWDGEQ